MAIELIDKIKQKNNQDFKLVDAFDVDWSQDTKISLDKIIDARDNVPLSEKLGGSATVPVLDQDKIDEMVKKGMDIPDDYIKIPNKDENPSFAHVDETLDRSYLDIMFSAIRSLQAEVAKLRNTMRYGLSSYTDENTGMAAIVDGYKSPAEEPVWAIEESDLSPIDGVDVDISPAHGLVPPENVTVGEGVLDINAEGAKWKDAIDQQACCKNVQDAKLFLYLTTSALTTKLKFVNLTDSEDVLELDLASLGVTTYASEKYNILVAVSRAYYDDTTKKYYGQNFIWLSICNFGSLTKKIEGYWNPDTNKVSSSLHVIGPEDKQEDFRYYIDETAFKSLKLYKFDMYSKYQDFSTSIQPSAPSDDQYKYEVAHITIRSVADEDVIKKIIKQLPQNELIYCRKDNGLYIVNERGRYKKISGSGGGEDTGMTKTEIIDWLKKNGIHVTEDGGEAVTIDDLQLGQITFINQDTGKAFKFTCSPDGKLNGEEIPEVTLSSRMKAINFDFTDDFTASQVRGFSSNLAACELTASGASAPSIDKDFGLNADRVKIGAIYAPQELSAIGAYSCSHAYVELENTSTSDFQLDGCYLHYARQVPKVGTTKFDTYEQKLALKGKIPAGGTYLIRGKQYTSSDSPNCMIDVKTFDQEWYVKDPNNSSKAELIDFTLQQNNSWLLTYGNEVTVNGKLSAIDHNTVMVTARQESESYYDSDKCTRKYDKCFIDVVSVKADVRNDTVEGSSTQSWANTMSQSFKVPAGKDCIYKNTFQLDPAKQAFQATTGYDSSRVRNDKDQDFQPVILEKAVIEFPKTAEAFDVKKFTPKASFEGKNVCTDKTALDFEKPNMVTCAFGIDMHKTRCFNWISTGIFNEYVWIRAKDSADGKWIRFESYKDGTEDDSENRVSTDKDGTSYVMSKRSYADSIKKAIYNRLNDPKVNVFPGCNVQYTAHKCIVNVTEEDDFEKTTTFEYVVGRADKDKNPDPAHTSEVMEFTIYPRSFVPRVFQITDQQGFHWIEYQAWAAAAKELNKTINGALSADGSNIIPVLINTGDMTQNGTRINEWLDYYNAGKCLFSHLEQMNVVGNNDLCGTDPTKLGTGDDPGKSNGYYFHVFYCYEVDDTMVDDMYKCLPIVNGKYVPSLYYFDHDTGNKKTSLRFVAVNSELTVENCKSWFKCKYTSPEDNIEKTVNVYTGWQIKNDATNDVFFYEADGFTPVYQMLYNMMWSTEKDRNIMVYCHEMPFTVITAENIAEKTTTTTADTINQRDRSFSGGNNSLVGSHLNKISPKNLDVKSNYWFSRLLEHFNVKLCIGGHKHTYSCTYPLRELYFYGDNKCSLDEKMVMPVSLKDDTINTASVLMATLNKETADEPTAFYQLASKFTEEEKAAAEEAGTYHSFNVTASKFPMIAKAKIGTAPGIKVTDGTAVFPYYSVEGLSGGVTYFMLQATGYKLKSNKELPSINQQFSYLLPKTKTDNKPADDQQYPMFSEIAVDSSGDEIAYDIYLYRIKNILHDAKDEAKGIAAHSFSQLAYGTGLCSYQYLARGIGDDLYGKWLETKTALIRV